MAAVEATVDARDWHVAEVTSHRLEATATTRWFGFEDDIVVRLTETPSGVQVDMRSASRIGRSDSAPMRPASRPSSRTWRSACGNSVDTPSQPDPIRYHHGSSMHQEVDHELASVRAFLAKNAPDIEILELETSTATVQLAAEAHGVRPARSPRPWLPDRR